MLLVVSLISLLVSSADPPLDPRARVPASVASVETRSSGRLQIFVAFERRFDFADGLAASSRFWAGLELDLPDALVRLQPSATRLPREEQRRRRACKRLGAATKAGPLARRSSFERARVLGCTEAER